MVSAAIYTGITMVVFIVLFDNMSQIRKNLIFVLMVLWILYSPINTIIGMIKYRIWED